MRLDSLQDRVIVLTGASSGIGKLAVEAFLKEGARLVLAARSQQDMQQHLMELGIGEHEAFVVPTDVGDFEQVQQLAQEAKARFGRIDIWINNASINAYGYVEDMDIRDVERIIQVDLLGPIYGMKVVLPIFLEQGYGNIMNINAIEGVAPMPLQSAYDAAKHGMLGFSCALREELMDGRYPGKQIDVVDILPASMDTPFTIHSKSMMGKLPRPMPPIYDPMMTVNAMVKHAKQPQPLVTVGPAGKLISAQARLFPTFSEWVMSKICIPGFMTSKPKPVQGADNLYGEMPDTNSIYGGFSSTRGTVFEMVKQYPLQTALASIVPLVLMTLWLRRRPA